MEQGTWKDKRVLYTRSGSAKYLSHLDVNRTMQRAIARSHLPVWYTQGFNPHIYLTFALPTPLGYESECETMDFRFVEEIPEEEALSRLNACLPTGLRAVRIAPPQRKPEDICAADYAVSVSSPELDAKTLFDELSAFFARETILAEKKTKKGTKTLDLKPLLRVLELTPTEDGALAVLRLSAGAVENVNPGLLFDAFSALTGRELDCLRVKKRSVYAKIEGEEVVFA